MPWLGTLAAITAVCLGEPEARAEGLQIGPSVGQEHEIAKCYKTSNQASDGSSSGNSNGCDAILERVIGSRVSGWEFEYDLTSGASPQDRLRVWMLPARVLRAADGSLQLLNRHELETRLEDWLERATWTRDVCGRWLFTWDAFQIECDPEAVLRVVESYDITSADLRDGAPIELAEASGPGTLTKLGSQAEAHYSVVLQVDPAAIHRARAESDVVIGEIIGHPVKLEEALQAQSRNIVTGTIEVSFDTDASGLPWRRAKVTTLTTQKPDGVTEADVRTETVERRLVSGTSATK